METKSPARPTSLRLQNSLRGGALGSAGEGGGERGGREVVGRWLGEVAEERGEKGREVARGVEILEQWPRGEGLSKARTAA